MKASLRNIILAIELLVILIFSYFSTALNVYASSDDSTKVTRPYRVLCILSYNYSYNTVPGEIQGIEEGLSSSEYDISFDITYESMDAKSYYKADDIEMFGQYLSYKLSQSKPYDLIMTTDDTALRFVINNREALFAGIPIVFMGVNSLSDAEMAASLEDVTGVAEIPDYESNYKLMRELFPERTKITAIVDGTNTGQGEFVQFMEFISSHPEQEYSVLNTSRYSEQGIKDYLQDLDDDDIILYLDFLENGDGTIYTLNSASKFITSYANNVPVFRVSSADVGNGVLGGVSYSFYEAGRIAGQMGAAILSGQNTDDIDMVTSTVTSTYFEQNAMDAFGISISSIPRDSVILNKRWTILTWYYDNTIIANLVITICILLVAIIVILSFTNRKREKMANTDALTGIPNRLFINKQISSTSNSKDSFAMIMVDLDYFKSINDTLGHLVGDEVLIELARRLNKIAKANHALAARIGGDEFLILLSGANQEKCKLICEQLTEAIKKPISTSKGEINVTLSMGGSIYPEDTDNPSNVLLQADKALYKTKTDGRNGYCMYKDI